MAAKVSVKIDYAKVNAVVRKVERGMNGLAGDISNRSRALSPHQTGSLENSTRSELEGGIAKRVAVGGVMAPGSKGFKMVSYARRRYFEGSRTGTDKWLTVAMNDVMRGNWERNFSSKTLGW